MGIKIVLIKCTRLRLTNVDEIRQHRMRITRITLKYNFCMNILLTIIKQRLIFSLYLTSEADQPFFCRERIGFKFKYVQRLQGVQKIQYLNHFTVCPEISRW